MGDQLMRRLVINQPTVDDRLSIGIGVDGMTENFDGLRRRCGGKTNFNSIKIIDDPAVFAQVIALIAVGAAHLHPVHGPLYTPDGPHPR